MAKILFIDDDSQELAILEIAFTQQGFEVALAKDGEEGLAKAKTFHPDIISLDLLLPKQSGIEVLDILKADPDTNAIPVVMLSNLDDEKDVEITLSKGAVRYIPKSEYTMQQVVDIIKQLLAPTPVSTYHYIPQKHKKLSLSYA